MKGSPRIPTVTFHCDHYLNHNSFVISGLCELAVSGKIRLNFRLRRPVLSDRNYWIPYIIVTYPSGRVTRIAFDFHDFAQFYCSVNLEISDLYFRANYSQAVVDSMTNRAHAAKMRRFGLYFAPKPDRDRRRALRYLGSLHAAIQKYGLRSFLPTNYARLYALYTQVYVNYFENYRKKLPVSEYHRFKSEISNPIIFFNPRCWPETDDSVQRTNQMRAEIVRLCRKQFGERFLGGFINTSYARENYPDVVLDRNIPHSEYIRLVQSTPINIYTQGMKDCISWKLLEYFAAGSVVVGERITNDLPPSELGTGFFFPFDTPEECATNIEALLRNPQDMSTMRQASYLHYENHLAPGKKMQRIILDPDLQE